MKNLLFTLFLICICFIESKGDIKKTILHNNVAHTINDTVDVINQFSDNLTQQEVSIIQTFAKQATIDTTHSYGDGLYFSRLSKGDTILDYHFIDWGLQLFRLYVVCPEGTESKQTNK